MKDHKSLARRITESIENGNHPCFETTCEQLAKIETWEHMFQFDGNSLFDPDDEICVYADLPAVVKYHDEDVPCEYCDIQDFINDANAVGAEIVID